MAILVKPGIVVSNTLTALAGWILASLFQAGPPSSRPLLSAAALAFGTAALVAGSAALNNWLDRDIDAAMARTKDRPTVTGRLGGGLVIGIGVGLIATGALILALARVESALIGLAGAFFYLVPYTLWAKRRSGLSSLVGGISGAIPPLIGWSLVDPGLGAPALLLFALLLVWQQSHVRALALKREGDFRRAAIPMAGLARYPNEGLSARARFALLGWVALLLPFSFLIGTAMEGGAVSTFSSVSGLAALFWLALGLLSSRSPRETDPAEWGRLMFLASLAYLVLSFAGLALAGIAGFPR